MKEIKEEIKREVVDTYIRYEATDGTVFPSADECKKYEESALGVIRTKVSKMIVSKDISAWDLMGGYDDNGIVAFKPKSKEDVDALMQLLIHENTWYSREENKAAKEEKYNIINQAFMNNDIVIFGTNCEGDYYFINSRQNIINNLMNLDKKEVSDNV